MRSLKQKIQDKSASRINEHKEILITSNGHETALNSSCNRPHHLRCASSIAAVDWDAHRVRLTTKTSRVERGRDERFAG
jgi:hypothetical protein